MKKTFFVCSWLFLTTSNSVFSKPTTVVQAKTKASAPSSTQQEPFTSLRQLEISKTDGLFFDDVFDSNIKSMIESMQKDIDQINESMISLHKNAMISGDVSHKDSKSLSWKTSEGKYSIKEVTNDENSYELAITLPGFTRDDVKVKFNQTKHKNITNKSLEIYAKKALTKEQGDNKSKHITKSEQLVSSSNINGKKSNIVYKDGELKMTFDLPDDISDQDYTMSFDKDELNMSFLKQSTNTQTKILEFKKTDKK